MTSDNKQEYTIHIFGQDITSQDGLFRLDEIRRVGIQIGKVEDNRSTEVARFMRTKAGRSLTNPENGFVKKINMGHLGTSWLADPVAAIEFGRWLDLGYGLAVTFVNLNVVGVGDTYWLNAELESVFNRHNNQSPELVLDTVGPDIRSGPLVCLCLRGCPSSCPWTQCQRP